MADWLTHGNSTTQSMAIAAALLRHYSFDMAGQTIGAMMTTWAEDYPALWLRAAVIEALYQGRYKAVSVQQILTIWQRRSRPLYHFNGEFERMVCSPLLEGYTLDSVAEELATAKTSHSPPDQNVMSSSDANPESSDHLASDFLHGSTSPPVHHDSIPPLRPFTHQPQSASSDDRSTWNHGRAINQFVPEPDSEFCQRLQAIATPNTAKVEQAMAPTQSDETHSVTASVSPQPASTDLVPSSSPPASAIDTTRLNEWAEDDSIKTSADSTLDADLRRLLNAGPEARD